jgi:hypothetical protein
MKEKSFSNLERKLKAIQAINNIGSIGIFMRRFVTRDIEFVTVVLLISVCLFIFIGSKNPERVTVFVSGSVRADRSSY